jgi:oxygen-dependent protoporphyrinogen oxidase
VRAAVVGGGIAGLAAALELRDRLGPDARITVYEQTGAIGGKLRTGLAAGVVAERGAESFLVRSPDGDGESAAMALARRVGLGDDLVHPAAVPAALWLGGSPRPFPPGTLLGVPGDPEQVAPVARVAVERDRDGGRPLLAGGADVAVGELVRRRLGDEVVDRLVDPMLGGVYAGRADSLSLATTMPGLAEACRTESTLVEAVRAARRPPQSPVFATIRGGLDRLAEAVAAASGAQLRLGLPVRELDRTTTGWRLVVGSTRDAEPVTADAVVLALPARGAARLLAGVDEAAAGRVGQLGYASVALVTFVLPAGARLPELSGFLVPATEGLAVKAATFLTNKWPHLRGGPVLVRASVGRYGEVGPLRRDDRDLAALVAAELGRLLGGDLPDPVAPAHVQRWGGSLPQYAPGHLDRVAAARAALPATLRLAGAGYDGVGIPACIRSGQSAATEIAEALTGDPAPAAGT